MICAGPRGLDEVDGDRCGVAILEREPEHDREHRRKPVYPEYARGLPIKIAEANQVELKQRRRSQHESY